MSIAKKEEVCSHQLVPRLGLGEPAVGVPIKKRPVFLSDRSAASAMPLSIKPPSPAKEMPISATGAGCGEESFFKIASSDPSVITKGKGITVAQIQDHANIALTALSMNNDNGGLFNRSTDIPSSAESATRTFAPADESQHQNFLTLDLQSPSHQNGKNNNYSSLVKEEKVDQGLSGFSSAESHNNVHVASEINACNSNVGRLPNLDLNVPLDPADSIEGLPTMHENGIGQLHRTIQHQNAQVTPAAPISTTRSGLCQNIDSTLNMSNTYGLSLKRGPADVTLDLQLKPPARPELGINWKGLAPAPELSLSLFGKPVDEPSLGPPNALFDSRTAGSSKKVSEETAAIPGSDKAPVEKIATLAPCNVSPKNTTSATVSGIDQMSSNNLVKKEPEETSQQHILNSAEKEHLLEQHILNSAEKEHLLEQHILNSAEKEHLLERPSAGPVNNSAESEKTDSTPEGPSKTGFDLNSDFFPNNNINSGLDLATDNIPIPPESLPDISRAKSKLVKCEESTSATPCPAVATGSVLSAQLKQTKSLPSQSNVANPAVALCESSSQPSVPTVWKPPASHIHAHEDTRRKPCIANEPHDALPSSSKPTAEPLLRSSRGNAIIDGMSQGSAEMDCSDDDDNTVSRVPITNKLHGEPLGNCTITKDGNNANNMCKVLKKEQDIDMQQDSSLTKVSMDTPDGEKCIKIRVGVGSHAGEHGLRNEIFDSEKSKEKQPLNSDKDTPANINDNSIHNAKTATGSSSTDLQRSPLPKSAPLKLQSTKQSPKTSNSCIEKTRSPDVKSEMSPHGKQAANCERNTKIAVLKTGCQTESEEVARHTDLCPRDSVLGEDSEHDGASSSQQQSECGKDKSASEKSERDKSKLDSCKTSLQNERDGQLVGAHWREISHAYVNRNERWERFMESERERNNGECHDDRHAPDMITHHRGGWRGSGPRGHPRNFRGPRMSNEFADEHIGGRRHSFEDEPGHLHRVSHRRRRSPLPGCLIREMDSFHGREITDPRLLDRGQIDLPDDMMDDRFFMPHSRRHRGDHGFMRRERSHSPAQRRGGHVHFHQGRSPEAMHRSPPLMRTERPYLPQRHHSGSHDERGGMQRSMRRCGMEGDAFEPPVHPAHLAELRAEEELAGRRKYRERRAYLRSPVSEEDEMLSYHAEDDMEFAEGSGGPREHDGRFRNRMGHSRSRGEHQEAYRNRGPQGWRDGDSDDSRPKRRRY